MRPEGTDSPPSAPRARSTVLTEKSPPSRLRRIGRIALRIAIILVIAYLLRDLIGWAHGALSGLNPKQSGIGLYLLIAAILSVYALMLAIPFVPGIEIGITLVVLRGPSIVPAVYLTTVAGLLIAYLAGHYLPYAWLRRGFAALRLQKAENLVERIEPLQPAERLAFLHDRLPDRLAPLVAGWRYVFLGVLLNVPGNALIGGGGGIMMVAGLSRLFTPLATIATVALALAPLPILIWVFGPEVFQSLPHL